MFTTSFKEIKIREKIGCRRAEDPLMISLNIFVIYVLFVFL